MRVYAALIPPEPVLRDLAAVVHSVGGDTDELDAVPVAAMHVAVSRFGNVTHGDAVALGEALAAELGAMGPMQLSFAGGTALEWQGDFSVWAKMAGNTHGLSEAARAVMATVERLGIFVDRRKFRTWLSVGEITDTTTPEYLQRLVDTLEAYRGPAWQLEELHLLRVRPAAPGEADGPPYEVLRTLPLGGSS